MHHLITKHASSKCEYVCVVFFLLKKGNMKKEMCFNWKILWIWQHDTVLHQHWKCFLTI